MSAILPAAARLVTLQQDCAAALPAVFDVCSVLYFASGQLTVATPTAGFAAKLKQQLPKLQSHLLKRGWQVNAIRLKVQVLPTIEKPLPPKQLTLPKQAVSAFAELADALSNSPRDTMLKEAVVAMVRRYS